ncbi:GGDEF domain-containing protein [Bacillaceae bacterium IKA-2]|nr:GGDEF domain-containing protein [Bacillaceae bacterium IKA-2]
MEKSYVSEMDYEVWSKKILYFYWIMVIITFVGHLVGLGVTIYYFPSDVSAFIIDTVIVSTSVQLIIVLVCEYFIRVRKLYNSHLLIIAGTLLALVVIVINPGVPGLQSTLLLPMAISLIYFDKRKLLFSFIVNVTCLATVYLLFPSVRMAATEYEYFSSFFVLFAGYFIYLSILQRGNEVLKDLHQASEKEKELMVKNTIMERLSKVDPLTGLNNHKTFHQYMDHLVEQCQTYQMPLQLAIIDIDNFKNINDRFGHSVGDTILKRVASTIFETASENDIVARYGGEEFAILFTDKHFDESYNLCENIRKNISNLHHQETKDNAVTVSVGLKDFHSNLTKYDFFDQADAMLYKAKESGKNKVVYQD